MQVPLEVTFRHVDRSEWFDKYIFQGVDGLQHLCDDLIKWRIALKRRHEKHHSANPFYILHRGIPTSKQGFGCDRREWRT